MRGWGQFKPGGCSKATSKEGIVFGKKGETWGIIQVVNTAGHCFALRDLVPSNFFKQVMIV